MVRRRFSREFKLEAVRLVRERGVSAAQAARDLDVHENQLRKWVREFTSDPAQAFPGQGQMKPEQLEIERLRREVAKLKAERDIQKKPRPSSRGVRPRTPSVRESGRTDEVRLHRETPRDLADQVVVRGARGLAFRLSRLADAFAEPAGERGPGLVIEGLRELSQQRPDLRRSSRLARSAG